MKRVKFTESVYSRCGEDMSEYVHGISPLTNAHESLCGFGTQHCENERSRGKINCPDCIAIVDACKAVEEKEMKRE